MGKVEDYRERLNSLDSWEAFLLAESDLPGPRANLELAFAVALEASEERLLQYASMDPVAAPKNSPEEFLAVAGVIGLGYLAAHGEGRHFAQLRQRASDPRWRIREAVALGLQEFGASDFESLFQLMSDWGKGSVLEKRAVVATLCEPRLLAEPADAKRIVKLLDQITAEIDEEPDRRSEEFRVLRKGLAYGWSVAVAAQPKLGKPVMEKWVRSEDADIRWIMRQNLKKKRLARMDAEWVDAQLEMLG